MNIFIYGFSPIGIELTEKENIIVIAPEKQKSRYIAQGFSSKHIYYVSKITLKECFKAIINIKQEHNINRVFTLDESIMDWCGALDDYFTKRKSNTLKSLLFKDKYYMRTFLQGIVEQPNFTEYEQVSELHGSILAKPRKLAAAAGIIRFDDVSEIDKLSHIEEYIFEEYVDYDEMFTVDGYAINGKIEKFFTHQYENKVIDTLTKNQEKHLLVYTNSYYWKDLSIIEELYDLSEKVLKALSKDSITPFHFEWFYNKRLHKFIFCEVGSRFGGAKIPQLIEDAFSINIMEPYWNLQNDVTTFINNENKNIVAPKCIAATFMAYTREGTVIANAQPRIDNMKEYLQYKKINDICEAANSTDDLVYLCRFTCNNESDLSNTTKELSNYTKKLYGVTN